MKSEELTERQKMMQWFVQLRWAGILMILAILISSIALGNLTIPIIPTLSLIIIAIIYNSIYPILMHFFSDFGDSTTFTVLRVLIDQLAITFLVHFTGGVESPFIMMYLLDITAIAVAGYEAIAYILSGCSYLFFLLLCLLEGYEYIAHYRLIFLAGTLYLIPQYAIAKALALLFISIMIVYIASYLSKKLGEKQKEIENLSKSRVEFMNDVVHEAKSPLTSIIGYSELLEEDKIGTLNEPQKEPVLVINRQAHRMLDMINDLLGIARLESGMAKIDKQKHSIIDVFNRVIEEEAPVLAAKQVEIVKEYCENIPALYFDETRIIEVITNLLSNAGKFSNPNGKIIISISLNGPAVLCSVRDEGIGIEAMDLPHIFDKFYRANRESAERKGTGLGLALSKMIIQAHGGNIWAVSGGRGEGAVFYFTLPIEQEAAA